MYGQIPVIVLEILAGLRKNLKTCQKQVSDFHEIFTVPPEHISSTCDLPIFKAV